MSLRCRRRPELRCAKEMNHLGNEFELFVPRQFVDVSDRRFQANAAIERFQNDSLVSASLNAHARAQRKREVDRAGAAVEKIKRPYVDGAARQIDAGWSG